MIWRRNSKGTRQAAWLALFAILLQALLPTAHDPASMAAAGPPAHNAPTLAGFDVSHYLCLAPGNTAPDDPAKAPAHHILPCALCLVMHSVGGFLPATAAITGAGGGYTLALLALALGFTPRQWFYRRQQPRGPPVLV